MIALIQSILAFSKKQSQAIIVVLLGIITAGGIAGGLQIQTLNKVLAEKNNAIAQLQEIEGTWGHSFDLSLSINMAARLKRSGRRLRTRSP